jgi:Domain of unknown function (DUF5916)
VLSQPTTATGSQERASGSNIVAAVRVWGLRRFRYSHPLSVPRIQKTILDVPRPGRPFRITRAITLTSVFIALATPVVAQTVAREERSTMEAYRLQEDESIKLDGTLDESVWQRGIPATDFVQRDPVEGMAPSESTTVYVVYNSTSLYIGAMLYDSDPSGILAHQKERDAGLGTDDRFMWILDTFLDGRTGYFFEINPAGLRGDGLIGGGGGGGFGTNKSWDGIWDVRVARGPYGWSAEIEIPFRTLNFDRNNERWGINFQRTVRRKNEESLWTGYRRNQQFTRPVHAGVVTGLEGMSQGLGLEAVPYVTTGWHNTPGQETLGGAEATSFPTDVGLDLSYNVTPSLRAALTVNTDFAEVEVDQRRINLTRFPLRFPERRSFFLEGSGVFAFSPRNGVTPFFSRNIGLAEGEAVPIQYGTRLGGQVGPYEIGFLHAHTGDLTSVNVEEQDTVYIPVEDFTAARVKRALFQQSSVGLIYTRRASAEDSTGFALPDRHTIGSDLDLFTSSFLGDKNLQFEAFVVYNTRNTATDSSTFLDRTARGLRINFPNDIWEFSTSYRELGDAFEPALGFTERNGFRRIQPRLQFAPRPHDFLGIRQFEFEVRHEHLMDMNWNLETRETNIKPLGVRFHSGDQFDFQITQQFERLDAQDAADLSENLGAVVTAGDYTMWRWRFNLRTAGRRPISANVEIGGGGFWTGARTQYQVGLTVRPTPGVTLGLDVESNRVSLEGVNDFTASVFRLETAWQFTPMATLTGNLQYDDQSEVLGLFTRFRWIITPGNDLFLVHTYNWQNRYAGQFGDRFAFATLSRGLTTKLSLTQRF